MSFVAPMLAVAGSLPAAYEDSAFGYEMKWDGVRAIVVTSASGVELWSRNGNEVSGAYPELRGLAGRSLVLDGEIVAFDAAGAISFAALQQRMHVRGASAVRQLMASVPVSLLLFDALSIGGRSLLDLPYSSRRAELESLGLSGPSWDVPPAFSGGGGAAALELSRAQRLEGVLAKRLTSVYEPGRRSADWLKIKHFATQEVVIGGWKPGEGRRSGAIGSLLCGLPVAGGGLRYVGNVGTGFSSAALDSALALLRPLEVAASPFVDEVPSLQRRGAHWVRPELVGEVAYGNWTPDGRLRHPSWRGWRPDKSPGDVVKE
ncbi:bifunctional non-homologous end joining protein LigD [Motilibacter rhizosphaerae]|uniref:DNA ligase (ATP) n=1 Tax=Motilibacter rhizosphaerae TaxID=598652 RepID=A0A4Q7NNS6_9ACTN|nr:non-homologous end-joining DNA ligase [Motilibacter rhizosphaerae]RZS86904.1 bifunctional non-homologous end joining protein LigD [Motilibacter rhizosphaerae]